MVSTTFKTLSLALFSLFVTQLLTTPPAGAASDPPFALPAGRELQRIRSAELVTSRGTIVLELFPEEAPWHVANFKYLADNGFYRGLHFHIFQPNFIVQGGAAETHSKKRPGWTLAPEFSDRRHRRGILGMARVPDTLNTERRSHATQFHLLLADAEHMDGSYTIFGRVVKGWEVLDRIGKGERIEEVRVYVVQ